MAITGVVVEVLGDGRFIVEATSPDGRRLFTCSPSEALQRSRMGILIGDSVRVRPADGQIVFREPRVEVSDPVPPQPPVDGGRARAALISQGIIKPRPASSYGDPTPEPVRLPASVPLDAAARREIATPPRARWPRRDDDGPGRW